MPSTLVPTPGSASANTYATRAEADTYNADRPFATSWAALSNDVKDASLLQAARLLDSCFNWTGAATDEVQALTWPRQGMLTRNGYAIENTVIPQQLKNAQCEWARLLAADDLTSDLEQEKQGLSELKIGPIGMKFKHNTVSTLEMADAEVIRRNQEFDYLWKAVPDSVRNLLVASWYQVSRISRPMLFESMR